MAKRFDAPTVQEGITWLVNRGYHQEEEEVQLEYELVQFENARYLQSFVEQQQPPPRRRQTNTTFPSFDHVIDLDEYEKLMYNESST